MRWSTSGAQRYETIRYGQTCSNGCSPSVSLGGLNGGNYTLRGPDTPAESQIGDGEGTHRRGQHQDQRRCAGDNGGGRKIDPCLRQLPLGWSCCLGWLDGTSEHLRIPLG